LRLILLFFITVFSLNCFAGIFKGVVLDEQNNPIPFASVYVKNSTIGTSTNLKGEFKIDLEKGIYDIVFSFVGYQTLEQKVEITRSSITEISIVLKEELNALGTLEVYSDKKDRAKEIMYEVRKKRSDYNNAIDYYVCDTYLKTSLDKKVKLDEDSIPAETQEVIYAEDINQFFKKENLNLIESVSKTYYKASDKYKEEFIGFNDYSESKGRTGESITFGVSYGEDDIAQVVQATTNPNIIYDDILSCDFNFYQNQIVFPELTIQPLISPLAETSGLSYQFNLEGSFYEDSVLIYKIRVKPIFITDAAFNGFLYVEDSTWMVRTMDLSINSQAMHYCEEFHIIQNYKKLEGDIVIPVRRELNYVIKDGSSFILGNTRVEHRNYIVNQPAAETKWNNEVKSFAPDAYEKSDIFWAEKRLLQLEEKELKFIHVCDSLSEYFSSEEYLTKTDSSFNRFNKWSPFVGFGRRNSFKRTEWYISGLLEQVVPFGIGGYRHKLPARFEKEFDNNFLLETDGHIDYGFRNKDVKGSLGVGLTYVPKKFVRTFIRAGDFYDQVNDYASLAQTFSRSNYVRNVNFSIAQRMEIINGLFAELTLNYSDQRPITNIILSNWSNQIFGQLNTPVDFERYIKSEVVLEMKYRIKQKFMYKENKKVILESKYPVLTAKYKKGIPGLLNSEVNYDFLELGASHELKLKRFGLSSWKVKYGTYLNKENLRVLEHKYFRGSDQIIFSNPIKSFQLLGPTLSTANDYFQANYMHHFEGSIMNKIPIINRLKLQLAGGAGILMIEDDNFRHAEVFVGMERAFKLWQELLRVGVYAVTADDTIGEANFTVKVGLAFYSPFTRKWDY
jgi:hypothetical protein